MPLLVIDEEDCRFGGSLEEIQEFITKKIKAQNPSILVYEWIGNYELMRDGTQFDEFKNFNKTMSFICGTEFVAFDPLYEMEKYQHKLSYVWFETVATAEDILEVINDVNLLGKYSYDISLEDIKKNKLLKILEDSVKKYDRYSSKCYYK